jgi:hypothetical protein
VHDDGRDVARRPLARVHAHPGLGLQAADRIGDDSPRVILVRRSDRIFEVQDQRIGAARVGFGDTLRPVARHVEVRARAHASRTRSIAALR